MGILGGGQLAQMLAQSARTLGLVPIALLARSDDPAHSDAEPVLGSVNDLRSIEILLAQVDACVVESEFIPDALLIDASRRTGTPVLPRPEVLARVRNKLEQKRTLKSLSIPTAAILAEGDAVEALTGPRVLKWAEQGYDGYGTLVISPDTLRQAVKPFIESAKTRGVQLYAEEWIPFRRELALVAVRGLKGEFTHYPLMITQQNRGTCLEVRGPATSLGVAPELETQAIDSARRLSEALDLVGTFAIEFFETEDSLLLVNEIAPRVHNSGHVTQDAAATSQFENHWRAVLGLELGTTQCARYFGMRNILGPESLTKEIQNAISPQPAEGLILHWYGKTAVRARRKLGHINCVAESPLELEIAMNRCIEAESAWKRRILSG